MKIHSNCRLFFRSYAHFSDYFRHIGEITILQTFHQKNPGFGRSFGERYNYWSDTISDGEKYSLAKSCDLKDKMKENLI